MVGRNPGGMGGDAASHEWLIHDTSRALRPAVRHRVWGGLSPVEVEDVLQKVLIGLHGMRRCRNVQKYGTCRSTERAEVRNVQKYQTGAGIAPSGASTPFGRRPHCSGARGVPCPAARCPRP